MDQEKISLIQKALDNENNTSIMKLTHSTGFERHTQETQIIQVCRGRC